MSVRPKHEVNYVACPAGHKINVIWIEPLQRFAFVCDICDEHSPTASTPRGGIEIWIQGSGGPTKSAPHIMSVLSAFNTFTLAANKALTAHNEKAYGEAMVDLYQSFVLLGIAHCVSWSKDMKGGEEVAQ